MCELPPNNNFLQEILEQPEALVRCVDRYPDNHVGIAKASQTLQRSGFDRVVITGMGSSEIGGYPLWLRLNIHSQVPVILADASELIHHSLSLLTDKSLLISVSQSGESIETVQTRTKMAKPRVSISITNGLENSLANMSDISLDIFAGEEATVSTKTYVNTLAVLSMLGCQLTGGNLPELRQEMLSASTELAEYINNWAEIVTAMSRVLGKW